jgi:hypothetical protein
MNKLLLALCATGGYLFGKQKSDSESATEVASLESAIEEKDASIASLNVSKSLLENDKTNLLADIAALVRNAIAYVSRTNLFGVGSDASFSATVSTAAAEFFNVSAGGAETAGALLIPADTVATTLMDATLGLASGGKTLELSMYVKKPVADLEGVSLLSINDGDAFALAAAGAQEATADFTCDHSMSEVVLDTVTWTKVVLVFTPLTEVAVDVSVKTANTTVSRVLDDFYARVV